MRPGVLLVKNPPRILTKDNWWRQRREPKSLSAICLCIVSNLHQYASMMYYRKMFFTLIFDTSQFFCVGCSTLWISAMWMGRNKKEHEEKNLPLNAKRKMGISCKEMCECKGWVVIQMNDFFLSCKNYKKKYKKVKNIFCLKKLCKFTIPWNFIPKKYIHTKVIHSYIRLIKERKKCATINHMRVSSEIFFEHLLNWSTW